MSVRRSSSLQKLQKIEKDTFQSKNMGNAFFIEKNGENIIFAEQEWGKRFLVKKNGKGIFSRKKWGKDFLVDTMGQICFGQNKKGKHFLVKQICCKRLKIVCHIY